MDERGIMKSKGHEGEPAMDATSLQRRDAELSEEAQRALNWRKWELLENAKDEDPLFRTTDPLMAASVLHSLNEFNWPVYITTSVDQFIVKFDALAWVNSTPEAELSFDNYEKVYATVERAAGIAKRAVQFFHDTTKTI